MLVRPQIEDSSFVSVPIAPSQAEKEAEAKRGMEKCNEVSGDEEGRGGEAAEGGGGGGRGGGGDKSEDDRGDRGCVTKRAEAEAEAEVEILEEEKEKDFTMGHVGEAIDGKFLLSYNSFFISAV